MSGKLYPIPIPILLLWTTAGLDEAGTRTGSINPSFKRGYLYI